MSYICDQNSKHHTDGLNTKKSITQKTFLALRNILMAPFRIFPCCSGYSMAYMTDEREQLANEMHRKRMAELKDYENKKLEIINGRILLPQASFPITGLPMPPYVPKKLGAKSSPKNNFEKSEEIDETEA